MGISVDSKQIDILLFMKPPFKFPFLHTIRSLKSTHPLVCMAILIFFLQQHLINGNKIAHLARQSIVSKQPALNVRSPFIFTVNQWRVWKNDGVQNGTSVYLQSIGVAFCFCVGVILSLWSRVRIWLLKGCLYSDDTYYNLTMIHTAKMYK